MPIIDFITIIIFLQNIQEDEQATVIPLDDRGKHFEEQISVSDSIVPQRLSSLGIPRYQYSSGRTCSCSIYCSLTITTVFVTDVELVIGDFERHFSDLLVKTKTELLQSKKSVDKVYLLLKNLSGKDFQRYIRDLGHTTPINFDELFDHLDSYRWNCLEYELLEAIIRRNNCSPALQGVMEQHSHEIRKFKRHTPISKVYKHRHAIFKRKSQPKHYSKLTTKLLNADPDSYKLVTLDPFSEKVRSDLEFPLHLNNMEIGSIVVEWRFHKEHEYTLMLYLCGEEGRDLLEQCDISEILIDDIPMNQSVCYRNYPINECMH